MRLRPTKRRHWLYPLFPAAYITVYPLVWDNPWIDVTVGFMVGTGLAFVIENGRRTRERSLRSVGDMDLLQRQIRAADDQHRMGFLNSGPGELYNREIKGYPEEWM